MLDRDKSMEIGVLNSTLILAHKFSVLGKSIWSFNHSFHTGVLSIFMKQKLYQAMKIQLHWYLYLLLIVGDEDKADYNKVW